MTLSCPIPSLPLSSHCPCLYPTPHPTLYFLSLEQSYQLCFILSHFSFWEQLQPFTTSSPPSSSSSSSYIFTISLSNQPTKDEFIFGFRALGWWGFKRCSFLCFSISLCLLTFGEVSSFVLLMSFKGSMLWKFCSEETEMFRCCFAYCLFRLSYLWFGVDSKLFLE